jgi:hypothetical protein
MVGLWSRQLRRGGAPFSGRAHTAPREGVCSEIGPQEAWALLRIPGSGRWDSEDGILERGCVEKNLVDGVRKVNRKCSFCF